MIEEPAPTYSRLPASEVRHLALLWAHSFLSVVPDMHSEDQLVRLFEAESGADTSGVLFLRLNTGVGIIREVEWSGTRREAASLAWELGQDYGDAVLREVGR